jgi:hypothetical protein
LAQNRPLAKHSTNARISDCKQLSRVTYSKENRSDRGKKKKKAEKERRCRDRDMLFVRDRKVVREKINFGLWESLSVVVPNMD